MTGAPRMRRLAAVLMFVAGCGWCRAQTENAPPAFPRSTAPREIIRVGLVGNLELRSAATKLDEVLSAAARSETLVMISMKPRDSTLPALAELVRVLGTTKARVVMVVDRGTEAQSQVDPASLVLASMCEVGLVDPETTLSGKPREDAEGAEKVLLDEMLSRIEGRCEQKELARVLVMRRGQAGAVAAGTAEGLSITASVVLPLCSAREGNEKRYLNAQQRPRVVRRYEIVAGIEEAREALVRHLSAADQMADEMEKVLDLPDPGKRGMASARYREAGAAGSHLAVAAQAALHEAEELLRANPELARAVPPGEPRIVDEKSYRSAWESRLRQTSKRVQKLEEKSLEFAAVPK